MNISIDRVLAELGLAFVQLKVLQEENTALKTQLHAAQNADPANKAAEASS